MRSPAQRASDLAEALARATGGNPRRSVTPKAERVEIDVTAEITAEMHEAALAALRTADRYGQDGGREGSTLWAEILTGGAS